MAKLAFSNAVGERNEVELGPHKPVVIVGRLAECDIRTSDTSVSRRHSQFTWKRQGPDEVVEYRIALRKAQAACRLVREENGAYLNTLGIAQYRTGAYEDALATLVRADKLNGGIPADVAFIAMTHHQLEHAEEARAALDRLRMLIQDPKYADRQEAQAFLGEAESLITGGSVSEDPLDR